MGRSPCCAKEGLNKGAWTAMEDKTLTDYIKLHGEGRWRSLPKHAGLKRCGKSCRLRWLNYLRPDIKRGNIAADEEELIIRLHRLLGNRWSLIAGRLPGRTDNEIKNYWNTNLSKKLQDDELHRQSNAKQSDNKRVTNSSITNNEHVQPNVVIRTKAVKCTSVFINPPPPQPPMPLPPPPPPPTTSAPPTTCNTHIVGPKLGTDNDASTNNLVLLDGLLEGSLLEDFPTMDFSTMGEFNFSEFLNSPHNDGEQFSPTLSLEEPIVFPEEMMEDWRRSGCGLDTSAVEYYLLGE